MNLANWLANAWRSGFARRRVIEGYEALGRHHPETMADILFRAGVFQPAHAPGQDAATTQWNDGRKSLALEILRMANADPLALLNEAERLKPTQPTQPKRGRDEND